MSEIIDAKVGNPQNSTSKKWANFSQPWNLAFFQDYIFKKYVHFQSQRVQKWKIAHIWQSKEHKNNKKTPKNVSQKGLQSLTDVLQHPVDTEAALSAQITKYDTQTSKKERVRRAGTSQWVSEWVNECLLLH